MDELTFRKKNKKIRVTGTLSQTGEDGMLHEGKRKSISTFSTLSVEVDRSLFMSPRTACLK